MNRYVIVAILLFCGWTQAQAEFVDERTPKDSRAPATPAVTAASVARAGASAPAVSAPQAPQEWVLKPERPIHLQLEEWAKTAGWNFRWRAEKSWLPPGPVVKTGSFDQALESVVRGLYDEGKSVHLRMWERNRVAEVIQSTPQ